MPIIQSSPRELLAVEVTSTLTTTSTATDGAAFSPAWGGNFTVAHRTNIEIEVHLPSVTHSSTEWAGVIAYLDGVNLGVRYFWNWLGSVPEGGVTGKWRAALAAGDHTIAVRGKVGAAGTGTFLMSATDKGLLVVREV